MSIPLNPGRKPIDIDDAEEAIKWFAKKNGKTVEEMREIFKKQSEEVFLEMKWQDMYEDSELLKNICFGLMVAYQLLFLFLIWWVA